MHWRHQPTALDKTLRRSDTIDREIICVLAGERVPVYTLVFTCGTRTTVWRTGGNTILRLNALVVVNKASGLPLMFGVLLGAMQVQVTARRTKELQT